MPIFHVTVNGQPACTAALLAPDERLEPPACGTRRRERAEEYAAFLRGRHPKAEVAITDLGCPARGE